MIVVAVVFGSFGAGYLLATQVFFPRPDTAGRGVEVPELHGATMAEAEATLRGLDLLVGDITAMKSMATEAGRVLAQDPVPGQQLLPGAEVSLGVSAGRPQLRVPPVVGLGAGTARELLETLGFNVVVQQTRSAEFPAGVVARADPVAGTPRPLPAQVTLVVSTGPPEESEDTTTAPDAGADPGGEDAVGGA